MVYINVRPTDSQPLHTTNNTTKNRLPAQLLVRAILGLYLWAAFVVFRRAAGRKFGADTGGFSSVSMCGYVGAGAWASVYGSHEINKGPDPGVCTYINIYILMVR